MSSKLILLDIFSYGCMNCMRSLKFIKMIDSKYRKYGLHTILVHPPEWKFETDRKNILQALKKYKIDFPVITDDNKTIIKKLNINFWPTQILIKEGRILYKHIGEGGYNKLEDNIIKFLNIREKRIFREEPSYSKFPVVYLGKKKNGKIARFNRRLKFGIAYYQGRWLQNKEFAKSMGKLNSLTILTKGTVVGFVAKSISKRPIKVGVRLNGRFLKNISINKPQLYDIIKMKNKKQNELTLVEKKNLAVYSFSFQ